MSRWHSFGVGQYRASERHFFIGSKTYKPDATKPAILICPPYTQTADLCLSSWWFGTALQTLAENGWPILATDMGGTSTWGNDTAQAAFGDARSYASSAFGAKISKVIPMGASMGSLDALNWARANPTLVACIVCALAVPDLIDVHDNDRGSFASPIETAYGGSSGWNTAKDAHNPASHVSDYSAFPIQFLCADDDPYGVSSTITAFASGSGAEVVSLGSVGHDASTADPATVLSFVEAHA